MSDQFYVYEHWRTDKDECFYVGKGQKRRAYLMKRNNKFHATVVKYLEKMGYAVEVRIVESGLTEDEAFSLEIERIKFWRDVGVKLTNSTDGGTGTSGLKGWNKKPVFCLETQKWYASAYEAGISLKVNVSNISQVLRGKKNRLTSGGYHFSYEEIKDIVGFKRAIAFRKKKSVIKHCNPIVDGKDKLGRPATGIKNRERAIVCIDTGVSYRSANEAGRQLDIAPSSITAVCRGGRKDRKINTAGGLRFSYLGSE